MTNEKQLIEKVKRNIFHLSASMMDAPYHGFSGDNIKGVNFAIKKILEGTGITLEQLITEGYESMRNKEGE